MIPNVLKKIRKEVLDELGVTASSIPKCDLLIITGENGSGKTFIRRLFSCFLRELRPKVEMLPICLEHRSASSTVGFGSLIYGDETHRATSGNTIRAIRSAFSTSRKRENPHLIFMDEPEIGMSEEVEASIAEEVVEFMTDKPKKLRGIIVTTHSRQIASGLMYAPNADFLNLGGKYKTVDEWLNRSIVPIDLDEYLEEELAKFRRITDMLK